MQRLLIADMFSIKMKSVCQNQYCEPTQVENRFLLNFSEANIWCNIHLTILDGGLPHNFESIEHEYT